MPDDVTTGVHDTVQENQRRLEHCLGGGLEAHDFVRHPPEDIETNEYRCCHCGGILAASFKFWMDIGFRKGLKKATGKSRRQIMVELNYM